MNDDMTVLPIMCLSLPVGASQTKGCKLCREARAGGQHWHDGDVYLGQAERTVSSTGSGTVPIQKLDLGRWRVQTGNGLTSEWGCRKKSF